MNNGYVHEFPNADDPPCHSEHSEESHLEKEKKEIHRFALNDRENALNDKGSALQ